MARLLVFVLLLVVSVLMAGLFGALHNQISYGVAPEYFHVLKFPQFGVPPYLHDRWGAAIVGVAASWWMGLVVGVPVLGFALRIKGIAAYAGAGLRAIFLVIFITAVTALLALGLLSAIATPSLAAQFDLPHGVTDPVAFLRAGAMHEGSYLGGLLGLICAIVYIHRKARKTRGDRHEA